MPGHKIRTRHAIAIEKNKVIGIRRQHAAVADLTSTKAVIWVPDMAQRIRRDLGSSFDRYACVVARTVVGDDDVKCSIGLCATAGQYASQRVRAVIRRNDEGDATRLLSACHDDAASSA